MISSNKTYYKGFTHDTIIGIIWIVFGLVIIINPFNDWTDGLIISLSGTAMLLYGLLNKSRFKVIMMDDQNLTVVDGQGGATSFNWTQIKRIKRRLTLTPTYRLILKDSDEDILFYSDWGTQKSDKGEMFPSFNWTNRMGEIIKRKKKELKW